MTKTRPIVLAGTTFDVPMLPIRLNEIAYPVCRKLHNEGLLERIAAGEGAVTAAITSSEDMKDLANLAFVAVQSTNPNITREEFDNWPIAPAELIDAFYLIRYQTGVWIEIETPTSPPAGDDQSGEAVEAETLPT